VKIVYHTRMSKRTLVIALLIFVTLPAAGCAKKAAEKTAENAIEKSTNGTADVDIKDNSVTVNTNGGSWQAGEQVSLPSGFPSDIYVVDGTIKTAVTTVAGQAYMIALQSTKTVSEIKTLYESKLAAEGWTISANMTIQTSVSLVAEKGNRTVTLSISPSDDGTTVVSITTAQKES